METVRDMFRHKCQRQKCARRLRDKTCICISRHVAQIMETVCDLCPRHAYCIASCFVLFSVLLLIYNEMEWSKCKVAKLIELYEQEMVLWNITSSHHKNSNSRHDALQRISQVMECSIAEVEKKLHNLRSQYLHEGKN